MTLQAPEPLTAQHRIADFDSGSPDLDAWLKRRALTNQQGDSSRTYVMTNGERVVGYYALSSGSIMVATAAGRFRPNQFDPIPVALLGRLAVDRTHQKQGLGRALFREGAKRIIHAADLIGIRGLIVHAISEEATAFYRALGFDPSPLEPMTLLVTLADLRTAL